MTTPNIDTNALRELHARWLHNRELLSSKLHPIVREATHEAQRSIAHDLLCAAPALLDLADRAQEQAKEIETLRAKVTELGDTCKGWHRIGSKVIAERDALAARVAYYESALCLTPPRPLALPPDGVVTGAIEPERVGEVLAERDALKAERRTFPLQPDRKAKPGPVNIPWSVAEKAYGVYALRFGKDQSLARLAERQGFSWSEMDMFLPGWREECSEIDTLRAKLSASEREAERLRADVAKVCDDWVHGDTHTTDWLLSRLMPIAQRGFALRGEEAPRE
jgi:hypothetical protein